MIHPCRCTALNPSAIYPHLPKTFGSTNTIHHRPGTTPEMKPYLRVPVHQNGESTSMPDRASFVSSTKSSPSYPTFPSSTRRCSPKMSPTPPPTAQKMPNRRSSSPAEKPLPTSTEPQHSHAKPPAEPSAQPTLKSSTGPTVPSPLPT